MKKKKGKKRIHNGDAEKTLEIIIKECRKPPELTYKSLCVELKRDPDKNCRAVGQVCDKLDAVSVLAGVPLMALAFVRNEARDINPRAFCGFAKERFVAHALEYNFNQTDFDKMQRCLQEHSEIGN